MKYLKCYAGPGVILLILLFISPLKSIAQIAFNNPSFEGSCAQCGGAAPGWTVCASSPDVLPGCFGANAAAQNGSTYAGFCTGENIGQLLPQTLMQGVSYSFTAYLKSFSGYGSSSSSSGCTSLPSDGARGSAGRLQVWAGTSACTTNELLYTSPVISSQTWTQYSITFTPVSNNYNYIMLVQPEPGVTGANIQVDNLSPTITVMPITLLDYKVKAKSGGVMINWRTSSEKSTAKYIIERSIDGISYQSIATVRAAGNSTSMLSYSYFDSYSNKAHPTLYYRVKSIDFNTSESLCFSSVVNFSSSLYSLNTVQTINDGSLLVVEIAEDSEDTKSVRMVDLSGRTYISQAIGSESLINNVFTVDISRLPTGAYILYTESANGYMDARKFVK